MQKLKPVGAGKGSLLRLNDDPKAFGKNLKDIDWSIDTPEKLNEKKAAKDGKTEKR